MSKIRINDLARELEVKSKAILDVLPLVGVTEKKTHSSSIEDHEAVKVRAHFQSAAEAQGASKSVRASRADADEIKTKIDLSHISKPGDVLKLITKQQTPAAPPPPRPVAPPRRMIVPQTGPRPVYKAPPPRPAAPQASTQPGAPMRPAPGRPVPGQPIFQRPRPGAPQSGTRPPLRPGERRPMHPTRQSPT